jgi:nitrate reductase (NAD(P)H)
MMPDYHIGTLSAASRAVLEAGEATETLSTPREIFLQTKVWSKGVLSAKTKISADTKIFTFDLEHSDQAVGLPVGQHLMIRLRDPATREAIIRAYTPISDISDRGKLNVLVKVYYDTVDRKGGKMTQALDSIPLGHYVDFKGPVGKFEYLGRGLCSVSGHQRKVSRFIMVCAGSGVTPIFQVLRAVMADKDDSTSCIVLDGNRTEEDILCRQDMDRMVKGNDHRCRLLYMLSRPGSTWTGLKGRMDKALFEKEIGSPRSVNSDEMVLVCGPEALENSVRVVFSDMGWKDDDLLFF